MNEINDANCWLIASLDISLLDLIVVFSQLTLDRFLLALVIERMLAVMACGLVLVFNRHHLRSSRNGEKF